MWNYLGLIDPDRVSSEELAKDEVWSQLDRVLHLRAKESLEGKLGPIHAVKLSILVPSLLLIPCLFLFFAFPYLDFDSSIFVGTCRLQIPTASSKGAKGRGLASYPEEET